MDIGQLAEKRAARGSLPEIAKTKGRLRLAGHNGPKIQKINTNYLNSLDLLMNH